MDTLKVTHSNACRKRSLLKTTKLCYRGIARLDCIPKRTAHLWLDGVHGALTAGAFKVKPSVGADLSKVRVTGRVYSCIAPKNTAPNKPR